MFNLFGSTSESFRIRAKCIFSVQPNQNKPELQQSDNNTQQRGGSEKNTNSSPSPKLSNDLKT